MIAAAGKQSFLCKLHKYRRYLLCTENSAFIAFMKALVYNLGVT